MSSILKVIGSLFLVFIFLLLALVILSSWQFWQIQNSSIESFPLTLKWEVDLGNSNYDHPYYQDDVVFLPTYNYWYGVEATSGQIIWSQEAFYGSSLRCLTPDYMIVSGQASFLNLNPNTGKVIWEGEVGVDASCSDTTVFNVGGRSIIYAYDLATGENIWSGTNPRESFTSVIYNSEADELIADGATIVEPSSGHIARSFEPPFIGYGTLFVDQEQLFVGGNVRDATTGQVLYVEEDFNGYVPPTVTADTIYIADTISEDDDAKGITALDRNDYQVKWQYAPYDEVSDDLLTTMSSVAIFDGVGYVIFSDATLRAFDLETGQELGYWQPSERDLFEWSICRNIPFLECYLPGSGYGMATSEDRLFISFGYGKLYAFGSE